jgi:predicted naringenin-chalcone synthase
MSFINKIGIAQAPYKHAQHDICNFMMEVYESSDLDKEKIKRLYERSEINYRYSVLSDFSNQFNDWTFLDENRNASLEKRMQVYFELAPQICEQAIRNCISSDDELQAITHLITVSCTGLSAPGLDIQLLQKLNLPSTIHRTSINFMGCYAAIHALKQADAICKSTPNAKVLIVDIELCTLHFQSEATMDNVASSLLFGDGCAAVIVSNEIGLYEIEHFYSEVALTGLNDMAWNISSSGFLMTLSGYVADIIASNIEPMLLHSLGSMGLNKSDIDYWAIHPGGKKIVNEIQKAFQLSDDDVAVSRKILLENGNMSSATLLYVLNEMRSKMEANGKRIYAVAFGPGLTIESMFLKSC